MVLPTSTHISLLVRLAAGEDQEAWAEFNERYGPLLDGFCRRRGLQDADREDVRQEVLASLSKAMPGFRYDPARGSFRGYLKTIAVRAISRKACQDQARPGLVSLDERTGAGGDDPAVDDAWEAEWRQYHLRQAMRTVESEFNEADRAAFRRYALEGGDARETAQLLGLSLEQVYQAKSRIMRRLSDIIAQQVADEG